MLQYYRLLCWWSWREEAIKDEIQYTCLTDTCYGFSMCKNISDRYSLWSWTMDDAMRHNYPFVLCRGFRMSLHISVLGVVGSWVLITLPFWYNIVVCRSSSSFFGSKVCVIIKNRWSATILFVLFNAHEKPEGICFILMKVGSENIACNKYRRSLNTDGLLCLLKYLSRLITLIQTGNQSVYWKYFRRLTIE